jgi:amino acid adenylation domain-containing protein/non-ribosomal peptide synthase protein (TIGR01720 family)
MSEPLDAELLDLLLRAEGVEAEPRLRRREPGSAVALSFAQQRLWVLQQMDPASAAYNLTTAVRWHGPLDAAALEEAVNDVVVRHEVLRTEFPAEDGRPVARVLNALRVRVQHAAPGATAESAQAAEAARPFDPGTAPLLRLVLVGEAPQVHVLVLTMHHIVADAWSMEVLVREIGLAYAARCRGAVPEWTELPVQYADYAGWQRAWLATGVRVAQLEYWKRRLANPPALELPMDRPRTPDTAADGAVCGFVLPPDVALGLRRIAREEDATLFMVLLAAFQAWLHRWSGQDDVVVGAPVANRGRRELEPLIGFFVNTLVLRADFAGRPGFREMVRQVKRTAVEAYVHQDLPFDELVQELQPERQAGQNPLFQVMFTVQGAPREVLALAESRIEPVRSEARTAKFDLLVAFEETAEGISGGFEYRTALFDRTTIERGIGGLIALLRAATAAPDQPLRELDWLTAADRRRLLEEWSGRPAGCEDAGIAEMFVRQASRRPTAVALRLGESELSYAALDERANRLAQVLVKAGVGPDVCVGVCLERSFELIVALLAILKAGGAYVALEPDYPTERLALMLADAAAPVVIGREPVRARLEAIAAKAARPLRVVCLDREAAALAAAAPTAPEVAVGGEHLAYVSYTSGSTGRPKGVAVPQRGVLRLVRGTDFASFGPDDVFLQFAPVAFDASTLEIWAPLLNGAQLVIMPAGRPTLDELGRVLREARVTTLWLTAGLFRAMVDERLDDLRGLKHLLAGGDVLPVRQVARVLAAIPGCRLTNGYGPTENTTFTCCHDITATDPVRGTIPIGRPIAGTSVYVLDRSLQPVPIGVPGELFTGGSGLARGYVGQPEATAEHFVASPFGAGRLYRTGDRVRWREDGVLEFCGRLDQQVKIRGYRIEPGEVEAALLAAPGVAAAAVVVRTVGERKQLVGYVVGDTDVMAVRDQLRRRLPEHLVPAAIIRLASLPLNANGKVDRAALPAPVEADATGEGEPRSETERAVAAVWRSVLGREQIGLHENYFAAGGDSIGAIQVASRLKRAGWQIEVRDLFQRPTIAELAASLRRADGAPDTGTAGIVGAVPLTPAQAWFLAHHAFGRHHFNQSVLLRPRRRLEATGLAAAVRALWEQHDALRTVLSGEAEARVLPADTPDDFSEVRVPDEKARLEHTEAVQRGFALMSGPLFKAVLYRIPTGDRLLLVAHHLVVDGVSWRILLEDLQTALQQHEAGEPIDLGPRSTSIRRWGEAASARAPEDDEVWSSATETRWPAPRAATANLFGSARTLAATLPENLTREVLTRAGTAYGTRVDELLLVALGRVLRHWVGGDGVRVLLEGHGRDAETGLPSIGRTVGWFTCLYPVTLPIADADIGVQVKRVKEALRFVPGKGIGYGIARYLRRSPALIHEPLPALSFNYLGQFEPGADGLLALADEPAGTPIGANVPRGCEVDAGAIVVRGRMELSLTFGRERYDEAEIERLLAGWQAEVAAVAEFCAMRARPEKTPADFTSPALTLDAYEALLGSRGWNAGDVEDLCRLSPMQAGLLFQSLYEAGSDAYLVQMAYRLRGPIELARMAAAWEAVGRRHTILRTSVVHEGLDEPLQLVWRDRPAEVTAGDLRNLAAAEQQRRITAARAADLARGFDLERDRLWRVALWLLADDLVEVVWSYHHLLLDGWSLGLVQRDLLLAYRANGPVPGVPGPSYRDYVRWLAARDPGESRRYWAEYLADFEQATGLPAAGPRVANAGYDSATATSSLGRSLSNELRALAARFGATLNTVLQAAWGLLLSRYHRTPDVVFGAIVSGRPSELPGVEEMVGPFICAVPVRVRPEPGVKLPELLRQLQEAALAGEPHHHLPIADIQTLTPLGRELFDHLLVFENYPVDRGLAGNGPETWRVEAVEAHDRTHYDLDVTVAPGDVIEIAFGYNRRVYDGAQIEGVGVQLRNLLAGMVARPEAAVGDYELAGLDEQRLVIDQFNDTAVPCPAGRTLLDLLGEAAANHAEHAAVIHHDTTLSYRELHRRADALAVELRRRGVGPEQLVGLLVERSADMIVAVLGVLKAGAAYLPLDPQYPEERLAFMLEDAEPTVIVTQPALAGRVPAAARDAATVWLDERLWSSAARPLVADPGVRPEHLAYLIYTSGSTGRPKGVAIEHRMLVNAAIAWRVGYGLGEGELRLLQLASLSFDVFAGDFIRALTNGGTLVVCDADTRLDAPALCELLQRHRITFLESTPGLILPLMEYVRAQRLALPDLQLLVLGSDTLPMHEYRRLRGEFGAGTRIVNSYGVTEATIDTSFFELPPDSGTDVGADGGSAPIGRPMANQQLFVLDERQRPCAVGVVGELYIGGAGVARGYHRRPELNAERFVTCELGGRTRRLYRTGDLARWRADGHVAFLGRGDFQAKVRGFRVEPGEIEVRLRQHPGVRDVVVAVRPVNGANELVAYVVPTGAWQPAEWRSHVLATLPEYMAPAYWVPLERVPLSANGKVDRRALPAPGEDAGVRSRAYVAPRTEVERRLAEIWREVLQVPRIGVDHDFFELGGHSLKAMQVATRVQLAFGVRPALREFFAAPTIAALAVTVTAVRAASPAGPATIPQAAVQPDYELSHAQQRLWLLHHLGGQSAYNMPEAYVLEQPVDADALERAFQLLVMRHEALRTAFVVINGEPRQRIVPAVGFALRRVDLGGEPDPEQRARELAAMEAAQPFDLTQPPLLRATLLRLDPTRAVFLFTMHHIVGDGWSGNVLYRELFALYAAVCAGQPDPLPPLRIHYKDFAVWQKAQRFDADEAYWLRRLAGAPSSLALPYDFPARAERDFRGDIVRATIDAAVLAGLRRLARDRKTTVANVVLAVLKLVLFQVTKQEDLCVGVSIANRQHPDLENLIGFFVNILPVRTRLAAAMEFDELLAEVTAGATEAFEHQEYPFDLLVQKVNPARASNRQPLLNVIYGYQNFSDVHVDIGTRAPSAAAATGLDARPLEQAFRTSKFDLTLFVGEENGGLALTLEYDTGLFRAATAQRYLALLQRFAGLVAST